MSREITVRGVVVARRAIGRIYRHRMSIMGQKSKEIEQEMGVWKTLDRFFFGILPGLAMASERLRGNEQAGRAVVLQPEPEGLVN